jgi:hypothetical protein
MSGDDRQPAGHGPFALWNRSGNRLVVGLLRSPLHALVSGRLMLITVTGRRSGREHTLPVMYERSGDVLNVPVMWAERKLWWRNLRDGGAPVGVRLRGREHRAHGEAVVGADGETRVRVDLGGT